MAAVQELKEQITQLIKNKNEFTVDSNVLIFFAQRDPAFLLNTLLPAPNFRLTTIVADKEIVGLILGKRFEKPVLDILQKVRDHATQNKKIEAGDPNVVKQHELVLASQLVLVPRKVVYDLLINDKNSYLNKALAAFNQAQDLLNQGKSIEEVLIQLATHTNEMKKFRDELGAKAIALMQNRVSILDIDLENFDYERYERVVISEAKREVFEPIEMISGSLKDVRNISDPDRRMTLLKTTFNEILNELSELRKKKHDADVQHIAHVLALNLENISMDSDQIYLIELHARQRPAA